MLCAMELRQQLICVSDAYCTATGMSRSRLSTILLSGGRRLQSINDGGDIGTVRFESAMRWLALNWPDGIDWPDGIARPAVSKEAAE